MNTFVVALVACMAFSAAMAAPGLAHGHVAGSIDNGAILHGPSGTVHAGPTSATSHGVVGHGLIAHGHDHGHIAVAAPVAVAHTVAVKPAVAIAAPVAVTKVVSHHGVWGDHGHHGAVLTAPAAVGVVSHGVVSHGVVGHGLVGHGLLGHGLLGHAGVVGLGHGAVIGHHGHGW